MHVGPGCEGRTFFVFGVERRGERRLTREEEPCEPSLMKLSKTNCADLKFVAVRPALVDLFPELHLLFKIQPLLSVFSGQVLLGLRFRIFIDGPLQLDVLAFQRRS